MARTMTITDIINNTNISEYFTIQELYQASSILPRCEIEHFDTEETDDSKIFSFFMEVHNYYYEHCSVDIHIKDNDIINISCTCHNFLHHDKCIHVAIIILACYKILFPVFSDPKKISNAILEQFLIDNKPTIKKAVDLELKLDINSNYYHEF